MAIISGKQILKPFIKRASGYVKSLLSAEHVEMGDGSTLQETVNELNSNLTHKYIKLIHQTALVKTSGTVPFILSLIHI